MLGKYIFKVVKSSWLSPLSLYNDLLCVFFTIFSLKSIFSDITFLLVLRWWSVCLQCGRPGFNPWVWEISWRRKWQSTPVVLPGKSHGPRSLEGYTVHGVTKSQTWLSNFTFTFSDISITTTAFGGGWFPFAWNIFLYPFTLNLSVSLSPK